jgi:glycosyltransferase involved in cell wall biosynthesis
MATAILTNETQAEQADRTDTQLLSCTKTENLVCGRLRKINAWFSVPGGSLPMTTTDTPRVTVISAWYNRMEGLEESVHSILQQEGVDFEYIIVDDCSTDETSSLLESIKSSRLHLLRNSRNIGFTRSMCKAANEARGEYIAVHDAGDISFPSRLAKQVERLDADPEIVGIGSGVIRHDTTTGDKREIDFHPIDSERNPFTHGEVMYRRKAYEAVGGYREIFYYSQDSDLWRRLGELGRFERLDEILYEHRVFSGGVAASPDKLVLQAIFSNLGLHSHMERLAGRRDPVEKWNAASLLLQPLTPHFKASGTFQVKDLLKKRRFGEAKRVLETVPLGMLTWKLLVLYLVLAPIFKKPPLQPKPLMSTFSNEK